MKNGGRPDRSLLMTPNPSLSIPGTVRQDAETYRDRLGILDFPLKPNGKPMSHLVTVTQAVVFADSPRQQLAKDFLSYLTQPEIIASYLKASGDRNLPVHKSVWQDPYWTNPKNPHLAHAAKILTTEPTRPFYIAQNPAYSIVLQENIWGQALNRIAIDNLSPEQAADEAISKIKEIFNQWDGGDK
ncbi:ABC transporter substrate-binding protein [Pleurocapsa sp. PCC 7319]|uniref:ABC transporter substrate-binding protein n=1 Tax=Pleurocapsa sp. PCC 7319 TaxID=118161 RepID=UPI000348B100|nr:ABC transporter substrate-binding protein [Pleurocapsa sp. PCC 7319]